jgi:hypothetical protein
LHRKISSYVIAGMELLQCSDTDTGVKRSCTIYKRKQEQKRTNLFIKQEQMKRCEYISIPNKHQYSFELYNQRWLAINRFTGKQKIKLNNKVYMCTYTDVIDKHAISRNSQRRVTLCSSLASRLPPAQPSLLLRT